MKVIYTGPETVQLPDLSLYAEPGKPVNVPADVAAGLLERPDWVKAEVRKSTTVPEGSDS